MWRSTSTHLKPRSSLKAAPRNANNGAALERLQSTDGALLTAAENAEDELNDATDEAQAAADARDRFALRRKSERGAKTL